MPLGYKPQLQNVTKINNQWILHLQVCKVNALGTGALQGRGQGTAKAPPQKVFGMDDEYDGKPPVQPPAEPPKPYTAPQLDKGLGAVSAPTKRTQFLDREGYGVSMSDASSTADAKAGIKSLMDTDAAMQKRYEVWIRAARHESRSR